MSLDTSEAHVTGPSASVTDSAKDPIETALLRKWSPGVPLPKKVANEVAKQMAVSTSAVYKVRKRLSAQRAQAPQVAEGPTDGGTLKMEISATPKTPPPMQDSAPQVAAQFSPWSSSEIQPMFGVLNELITTAKRGPPPTDEQTGEISKLWAEALNAFRVPKGEKGGKVLVAAAAVVTTVMVYGPYLRRKPPQEEPKPQEEAPPA